MLHRHRHRMLHRRLADGSQKSGFMPQLESVLGAGSFDSSAESTRFTTLLQGGSQLAEALRTSWNGLRSELPDLPGALGDDACDAGRDSHNLQRELTAFREAKRFQQLDVAIRALPLGDMRRAAWTNTDRFSTTWVAAWPSPECRLSACRAAHRQHAYNAGCLWQPPSLCQPPWRWVPHTTRRHQVAHRRRPARNGCPRPHRSLRAFRCSAPTACAAHHRAVATTQEAGSRA